MIELYNLNINLYCLNIYTSSLFSTFVIYIFLNNKVMSNNKSMENLAMNTLKYTNHKREISQMEAVKYQLTQFLNDDEAEQLSRKCVDKFRNRDGNDDSKDNETKSDTVDDIVDRVLTQHKRKQSQFKALNDELKQIYSEKEVRKMTIKIMKNIFAKKAFNDMDKKNQMTLNKKNELLYHRNKVNQLKNELNQKKAVIQELREQIIELSQQKQILSINANDQIELLREYMKKYQQHLHI